MTQSRYGTTFDVNLLLKDPGLVAASGLAKVDGINRLIDVGDSTFYGVAVHDVTAIETDTGNELYTLSIQGGLRDPTSTKASPVILAGSLEILAELPLGATGARTNGAKTSPTGRYFQFFHNRAAGIVFPIIQLYIKVAGTVATGINFESRCGKSGF